jgi:ComF family protein
VSSQRIPFVALARACFRGFADLLLPRVCVACEALLSRADAGVACAVCWQRLARLPEPRCARCGHPSLDDACSWCALLPAYVRVVRSVAWMQAGSADALVHALKYHGWRQLASGMAERMGRLPFPADVAEERVALVPVPLAHGRERERGYNQSELIARALADRWGIAVWSDALARTRATRSQTRLTREQRLHNVAGAFQVVRSRAARLSGAHVVVVDDVVTTAATINACAAALVAGGARIVSAVTFARARTPGAGMP